ncbi:MAG: PQQ-binding-like beta-propeller repeat protein [Planctomycetales bacterium]
MKLFSSLEESAVNLPRECNLALASRLLLLLFAFALGVLRPAVADDKETAKQPPKLADIDWPVFRGNGFSTGVAPSELPEKLELLWKIAPEDAAFETTAVIAKGVVYVGGLDPDGVLYAVDLKNGKIKWEYQVESGFQCSPAVRDQVVYIGDSDGLIPAVVAKSGQKKWTFETGAEIISSPNFHKDSVLVGSYDQNLYCLNVKNGETRWKFETDGPVHSSISVASMKTAAGVQDRAFVAGCDQILHIVDLADGNEVGQLEIQSQAAATPAVSGSLLYVGNLADTFFCINWQKPEVVWSYQHPVRQFAYHSSAAVTAKAVFVGGRDRLLKALNPKTGELLWSFPTKRKIDSSPVVAGKRVFFGTDGGILYGLNAQSGEKEWEYEAGGNFASSPAIAGGRLVIGNGDGDLYCFGKK